MAFLFSKRQRSNSDLCKTTKDLLFRIRYEGSTNPRIGEELARNLAHMKLVLQGTSEQDASPKHVDELSKYILSEHILPLLAESIPHLPFESRKDAQTIFSFMLRYHSLDQPETPLALSYLTEEKPELIITLCNGYNDKDSAMPCGFILREALRYDSVAAIVLYDEPDRVNQGLRDIDASRPTSGQGVFWKFFNWIDGSAFEVATDAFNTFREVLIKHKKLVSHWLIVNYDYFMTMFNKTLIQSASYVNKRQSIKLLGEILLARPNYNVMTKYVESGDNLKLCMNLLKDERRMVQFEGFHIFKIFVANPKKSPAVQRILVNNKEKLLRFLPGFLAERTDDVQFQDEKAYLLRQIDALPSGGSGSLPASAQDNYAQGPGGVAA